MPKQKILIQDCRSHNFDRRIKKMIYEKDNSKNSQSRKNQSTNHFNHLYHSVAKRGKEFTILYFFSRLVKCGGDSIYCFSLAIGRKG
jgi:hypothetical protein